MCENAGEKVIGFSKAMDGYELLRAMEMSGMMDQWLIGVGGSERIGKEVRGVYIG